MTTYTKFKEYIWLVNTIYHAKAIYIATSASTFSSSASLI